MINVVSKLIKVILLVLTSKALSTLDGIVIGKLLNSMCYHRSSLGFSDKHVTGAVVLEQFNSSENPEFTRQSNWTHRQSTIFSVQ